MHSNNGMLVVDKPQLELVPKRQILDPSKPSNWQQQLNAAQRVQQNNLQILRQMNNQQYQSPPGQSMTKPPSRQPVLQNDFIMSGGTSTGSRAHRMIQKSQNPVIIQGMIHVQKQPEMVQQSHNGRIIKKGDQYMMKKIPVRQTQASLLKHKTPQQISSKFPGILNQRQGATISVGHSVNHTGGGGGPNMW